MEPHEEVLEYWLGAAANDPSAAAERTRRWFQSDPEVDAEIARRFGAQVERAAAGELDAWAESARGILALIILLDQFPRNLHRGSARAFAHDARALELCRQAIALGWDRELTPVERTFLYLPLEHAEDAHEQERCVAALEDVVAGCDEPWRETVGGFLDYARQHRDVIARFGRFPHRNAVLGRPCTPDEERYLADNGGFA